MAELLIFFLLACIWALREYLHFKALIESGTEITQLKADFAKFAGHTAKCRYRLFFTDDVHKCDCGLAEAQERWK